MRANPPLPPLEHNFIQQQVNQSDYGNEEVADYYQQEEYHHEQPYHGLWNDSSLPAEYDDYGHDDVLSAAMTLPLNSTGGEEKSSAINETTEDLANLSPEALRLNPKYVAYVPIPIKDDDIDEIAIDDDFNDDDDGIDRDDDELFDEDDHYDDDVTPRSSSVRRRPSANVDKVLLPILMVPAGERTKTRQGSDSWRSNDFSDSPASSPPRRFDEETDGHFEEEEHLTPSSSRRIPGPSWRRNNNGGQRRRVPGIDFRMFGSLAHQDGNNRRNQRPRYRNRDGPRDDFGRTTSLYPHRVLPSSRLRNNKGSARFVEDRETRSGPSLYIRPPPRPRPRLAQPQTRHYQPANSWSAGHERQRTSQHNRPTTSKPAYSYPRDAMSIQDIIRQLNHLFLKITKAIIIKEFNFDYDSYMTSLSHSSEQTEKQSPENRVVWSSDSHYHQSAGRSRVGESYPSVLPPPTPTGQTADSRQDYSHLQPVRSTGSTANPYSFKLDVYPIRDGASSTNVESYRSQSGSSYRSRPSQQSYRQSSSHYNSRQPTSSDSSANLGEIDYSYRNRYQEESSDPYRSRPRPYGNYDDQSQPNYRDEMPVPLVFRRPSSQIRDENHSPTTPKPKLVVHLNVFNQKGNR